MKILFTADLHGQEALFIKFATLLQNQEFDAGVIAGDLIDDNINVYEIRELLNISEEDLIPELPGADETLEEALEHGMKELQNPDGNYMRALRAKEQRIREILYKAEKPIFIVRGNHDLTEWESDRNIYNIHWKKIHFGGYSFVGYQYTEFIRTQDEQRKDFETLSKHIDERTLLVTHIPAFGVLEELIHDTNPWLHLHGHIHRPEQLIGNQGISINGAYPYLNRFYGINVYTREITYESAPPVMLQGVA